MAEGLNIFNPEDYREMLRHINTTLGHIPQGSLPSCWT